MKETIIIASEVNGIELLRSLAKFGVNTMGVRILNGVQLAKLALMRSGITVTEQTITSREQPALIYSFIDDIPYFKEASFADAENLSGALHTLRNLVVEAGVGKEEQAIEEGLKNGEFQDKNEDIFQVYARYRALIKELNMTDNIEIVRRAIREARPLDAHIYSLREYPLTPLEEKLAEAVSGGGKSLKEVSLSQLTGREGTFPANITVTEGYGSINEIENIIAEIYRNRTALDRCVLACTDVSSYSQLIYDLSVRYNIPVTFGEGIPISNSNPARLMKLIALWDGQGFNGVDALRSILLSEALDRSKLSEALGTEEILTTKQIEKIAEMAGALRISFDRNINQKRIEAFSHSLDLKDKKDGYSRRSKETLLMITKLSQELESGFAGFIAKFSYIRPEPAGRIDRSALGYITDTINAYMGYTTGENIGEVVEEIMKRSVCAENSAEGHLHITSLSKAASTLRENLYVCGLSAAEFPGSPSENYLLLDSDLLAFGQERVPTSVECINKKKADFQRLMELAGAMNINVKLSYSGYSLSQLKERNPSSVLFGLGDKVKQVGYFESEISTARLVGISYSNGSKIVESLTGEAEMDSDTLYGEALDINASREALKRAWSPSALEMFFNCPRRFYLTKVLGIPEIDGDDPFKVIDAASLGSLVHSMMEKLARQFEAMSLEEFLGECDKEFDDFLLSRPPLHQSSAEREKIEFLEMMEEA